MNNDIVMQVENLSKKYRRSQFGGGTLRAELQSRVAKLKGKDDPNRKLGSAYDTDNDEFLALDSINFTVGRGDAVGLVGRNGAGKSTLLKLISRITAPTTGEIGIKGRVASLLEVGTGFHQELTGRENIFLNGAILGMTRQETQKKLDEIVAFSEIEPFIDMPVKRYSSGMYVKLGFAVASHLDPDILICDEVLAVGDLAFQQKCIGKMKDVASGGRTIIYVSHNMKTVRDLCTTGICLERGKLIYQGTAEGAIEHYVGQAGRNQMQFDLTALPHKTVDSKLVRLTGLELIDSPTPEYDMDTEMHFRLKCRFFGPVKNVFLQMRIYKRGEPVAMSVSEPFASATGEKDVEVKLSMPLTQFAPGEFQATLSLATVFDSGRTELLDYVPDVFTFVIRDDTSKTHRIFWRENQYGYFRTPDIYQL